MLLHPPLKHGFWGLFNDRDKGATLFFFSKWFYFPHHCVGFLFLDLYLPTPPPPLPSASSVRRPLSHFVTHHLSHDSLSHHLCHIPIFHTPSFTHHLSHTSLSHTIFHTPSFTNTLFHSPPFTHVFVTHHLSHTPSFTYLFVTHHPSHTLFHTPLCHTAPFTHPSFTHQLLHTTLSLGDIHLRFVWQMWHLWHWAGSGVALRSAWSRVTSVTPVTPPSFCVAGVTLGGINLRFAWQAWHLVTWTFVLRGMPGHTPPFTHIFVTWRHPPSFCVAGVPLVALGWLWWRAWFRLVARDASDAAVAWQA